MRRPWFVPTLEDKQLRAARETKLLVAVDRLDGLTKRLDSVVSEVAEGDLGARERRR